MSKVTRIAYSRGLNQGKYLVLKEQAKRLGRVRSEVWQRFGSINGVNLTHRQIRDQWLQEKRQFSVLVDAWKETLRDTIGDISANREAAKKQVRRAIKRYTKDEEEQKRLYCLLKSNEWVEDSYLRQMMRKYWRRGKNHTHNQIVVRSDNYTTLVRNNRVWLRVPSLVRYKRIAIPLNTSVAPTGTLRISIRNDGEVEIHYAIDEEITDSCGDQTLGVDKGYTEVLVDSDGDHHGDGLGKLLSSESDYLKTKYQRRNMLKAIRDKALEQGDTAKADRIEKQNLGRKKLDHRSEKTHQQTKDLVFKAVHAVVDKANVIAAEDLTFVTKSKNKLPKNVNRRLAAWVKGCIAEALTSVSRRRSSTLVLVNAAYTSQIDSRSGFLEGKRRGDQFYCKDGVVLHADENAARNVLARLNDPEIGQYTPYQKVRSILLARTERHRLGLLNLDSSCVESTESELPYD